MEQHGLYRYHAGCSIDIAGEGGREGERKRESKDKIIISKGGCTVSYQHVFLGNTRTL